MSLTALQRQRGASQPGDMLVVIHDFDARSSDELTLRKTDRIELLELDEGFGDGWFLGKHLAHGTTGLFPGVYTTKVPSGFTAMGVPSIANPQSGPENRSDVQPSQPAPTLPNSDATAHRMVTSNQSANPHSIVAVPPSPTSYIPGVQRSIGQALDGTTSGQESPVMNETLSVIQEHITDLSTPRQSLAPPRPIAEDSDSEYSAHLDRASYVAGAETDSEDNPRLTEAEVQRWDAQETAEYLRSIGVDSKHCDIFEEQDITGDVLMEMDQSFIHMKEYDFGLMGRRLKTWHKIRDFQLQVRSAKESRRSSLRQNSSTEDVARIHSRGMSGNTILPRIPSLMEEPGLSIRQSQHTHPYIHIGSASPPPDPSMSPTGFTRPQLGTSTPPSPWRASMAAESPSRPSAASIRELSHSRRHSSIDFAKQGSQDVAPAPTKAPVIAPHKKKASLDRGWSMSNATTANADSSTPSLGLNANRQPENLSLATPPFIDDSSAVDIDRGYFSGNEVDNRKTRNVLRKRDGIDSLGHSRQSSALDESSKADIKRHSRLSSLDSSRGPGPNSSAAKAYHSSSYKARFRSASARNLTAQRSPSIIQSPTVTNLEDDSISSLSSPKGSGNPTSPAAPSSAPWVSSQKARKLLGLRTASEAVTGSEKEAANPSIITSESVKESPVASPSGSQTPSAKSHSFEMDNTDTSSKGTTEQLGPLLHTKAPVRTVPKTKRQTSAYTRGLLKISPAEARQHCDYHGWMRKKSTGLIAQWKPRLFILRGRRLSYYYSETDTAEKGIIDISGHKVLVASSDPITAFQATIGGGSTPPLGSIGSSVDRSPDLARTSGGGAPFFFKLVPPKAGLSRAVQFTKPTIHYFQVDNIIEGRKWMGEILKATIEHDLSSFETTNRQKTISLSKARERKERPPALKGTEEVSEVSELAEQPTPLEEKESDLGESGLNIQGLNFRESDIDLQLRTGPLGGITPSEEDNAAKT